MDPTKDNTNDNADVKPEVDTTSTPDKMPDTTGASDAPEIPEIPTSDKPVGAVDIDSLADPKTPDIPEAPITPAPEVPEMPNMDEEKPSSIEDDPNITIDSTKEPKDDPEEHKVLDVEPAPPAPGSIGSVKSGPATESEATKIPVATGPMTAVPINTDGDDAAATPAVETPEPPVPESTAEELVMEAANTPPVAPEEPEPTITVQQPKQSRRTTMILIIILAIILLGACIAGIVFLMQGSTQSNKTTNQPTITTTSTSELACAMDITAAQTEALQVPVQKAQNVKKFSYNNNALTEMSDTTHYTFENADVAKEKIEVLKTNYQNLYTGISLTQDPFESNFNISDAAVTVTHTANADQLNAKNAPIVGLKLDNSGAVTTDQTELKDLFEKSGYICVSADSTSTKQ